MVEISEFDKEWKYFQIYEDDEEVEILVKSTHKNREKKIKKAIKSFAKDYFSN